MNSMQRLIMVCVVMLMGTPENHAMKEDKKYSSKEAKIPTERQPRNSLYKDGSKLSTAKGRISPKDERELSETGELLMKKPVTRMLPSTFLRSSARCYKNKIYQAALSSLPRLHFPTHTRSKFSKDMHSLLAICIPKYAPKEMLKELTQNCCPPIIHYALLGSLLILQGVHKGWDEELIRDFKAYIKANKEMGLRPIACQVLRQRKNFSEEDPETGEREEDPETGEREEDPETGERFEEALLMCSQLPEDKMWVETFYHETAIGWQLDTYSLCALNLADSAHLFQAGNPEKIELNAKKLAVHSPGKLVLNHAKEDIAFEILQIKKELDAMYAHVIKDGEEKGDIKMISPKIARGWIYSPLRFYPV